MNCLAFFLCQTQIKYRPMNVNTSSIDYMYISSISDIRKMSVKCTGHCTGKEL